MKVMIIIILVIIISLLTRKLYYLNSDIEHGWSKTHGIWHKLDYEDGDYYIDEKKLHK